MIASFAFAVTVGILPEALLVLVALAIVCLGLSRPELPASLHRWVSCLGLGGAVAAALITLYGIRLGTAGVGLVAYGGGLVVDRFAVLWTVVAATAGLLTVLGSGHVADRLGRRAPAYHAALLVAVAAVALAASEREMIALFVSLQLLAVCTGVLLSMAKTNRRSGEAALKYAVITGAGSAVLLYGLGILYGLTGSTDLAGIPDAFSRAPAPSAAGAALALAGLAVVAGGVPLHHWVTQAAAGAPAVIAGAATTLGMLAGVAGVLRMAVGGAGPGTGVVLTLVAAIAALTMIHAAVMLLRPRPLRQLAGYLVLAQSGFMLEGIVSVAQGAGRSAGVVAMLVYAMSAAVSTLGLFGLIGILEAAGMGYGVEAHRGIGHRARGVSALLALALASLGGLPPLAVWLARMLVLESTVVAGYAWLTVVAAVASCLIAGASARFIATMYAHRGDEQRLSTRASSRLVHLAAGGAAGAAAVFTVIAQPLLAVSSGGAGTIPLH